MKSRSWHIQMFTNLADDHRDQGTRCGIAVPLVFDHFGGAQAGSASEQPGFADLLELVKSGKAYVKISGAYRASTLGPDFSDCRTLRRR